MYSIDYILFVSNTHIYVGSVLDNVSQNQYKNIQKVLDHFILYNSYCEPNKKSRKWINDELLYGDKSRGGYGHTRVTDFFYSITTSWIKRYATQLIDGHWCDLIDVKVGLTPTTRRNGAQKNLTRLLTKTPMHFKIYGMLQKIPTIIFN